ncbi:MAG: glutathionylspermidine synthase family protein [Defluviitaleaceae bacterium]|nr:glutathionylspermidine synthase family protein [Defluviitaleaceae bacterium]
MMTDLCIKSIPPQHYQEYRINVMFDGYKWDLQASEQGTISDKVVLLEPSCASLLADYAVKLYHETIAMESLLQKSPELVLGMGISQKMTDTLCSCEYDPQKHLRFMRFDFHPTTDGWRISEVNSDVPAGYPEASVLPALAQAYFDGYGQYGCFGDIFAHELTKLLPQAATIAYLHDTHTVEDYQILHYIGDLMEKQGNNSLYLSPEHIKWKDGKAVDIDGIVRYFPVEWMEFAKDVDWMSFVNSKAPSCNHPIALLTQSKRLPLVWDKLDINIPTWKELLPKTVCASTLRSHGGWILKPAFGRVGEGINIPGTVSEQEEQEIRRAASQNPLQWVAQKMFESMPICGLHLNMGVFVINGKFAGFYARASETPKIDENASEIPILVREVNDE